MLRDRHPFWPVLAEFARVRVLLARHGRLAGRPRLKKTKAVVSCRSSSPLLLRSLVIIIKLKESRKRPLLSAKQIGKKSDIS